MNKSNLLDNLKNYKNDNAQKYGILSIGVFWVFARNQATKSSDYLEVDLKYV